MKPSVLVCLSSLALWCAMAVVTAAGEATTRVSIADGKWHLNGRVTYPGAPAEGLLMNVRMVNAVFEDANNKTRPKDFDADANTDRFIQRIPDYVNHGVRAFTLCLQGGSCVYAKLEHLTTTNDYFPPPESQGGWRKLEQPEEIRALSGMDSNKLAELKEWLLESDNRDFAAVVIRNGYIVLEVERGNSARTDSRRVASVSKAVCATVLAIASEQSQQGKTPKKMIFDDLAFDFIPWAQPLSDPRKGKITVRQLLNHTSGICPEAIGANNDGTWEYVLGHSGDDRTAKLAFDPGMGCGYSTHALCHAALVCETVTGKPYDEFAVESLFEPIGCEHWWFQYYDGGDKIGRHPSHGMGMPSHDLARIAYCMLCGGRWQDQQVIPQWFVDETAAPTHDVKTPELRWKLNPQVFSHGWELPSRHWPASNRNVSGIPADARYKPGSGGQLIAFVPSLDLVITRQTGGSGEWQYEEYLRLACAAVLPAQAAAIERERKH